MKINSSLTPLVPFNQGDGMETIDDVPQDASVVVQGEGLNRADVKFRRGSLLVDLGPSDPSDPNSPHDQIHFEGFDALHPEATPLIGELRFSNGEVMTYADILAQGFDIDGTEGDDDAHDAAHPQLLGTGVTDRIRGFGGNDTLQGGDGNDVLNGGVGDDEIQAARTNDRAVAELSGEQGNLQFAERGTSINEIRATIQQFVQRTALHSHTANHRVNKEAQR